MMATAATRDLEQRLGRPLGTGIVRRVAGRDLSDVLARTYFRDAQHVVAELCANSIDAKAPRIEITYDAGRDILTISDDGNGMTKEEVPAFFWMGDSPKRKVVYVDGTRLFDPVEVLSLLPDKEIEVAEGLEADKRARRRTTVKDFLVEEGTLGKWGLGSVAVKALSGTHYQLETAKGGKLVVVREDVRSEGDDRKGISWTEHKAPAERHGTTITLYDVRKSLHGRTFDPQKLEARLAREMPLTQVDIYVNRKKLSSPQVKNATPFKIDERVPGVGHVHGLIYLSKKPIARDEQGVLIRVHGRAIGDRRVIDVARYSRSDVAQRVTGDVHADGLDALIGIDRSRFGDHGAFQKVEKLIARALSATKRAYEHLVSQEVTEVKRETYIKTAAVALQEVLTKHAQDITGSSKRIRVECNPSLAGPIATYDPDTRVLQLNPENVPLARIPLRGRTDSLGLVFESYAVYALAKATVTKGDDDRAVKPTVLETEVARIFAILHKGEKPALAKRKKVEAESGEKINEFRMYEHGEVARICYWDDGMLDRIIAAELLKKESVAEALRIHGRAILELQERLRSHVTVYELLRDKYGVKLAAQETRVLRFLRDHEAAGTLPSYLLNLAARDTPFYAVHETRRRTFEEFAGLEEGAARPPRGETIKGAYTTRRIGSDHVVVYARILSEAAVPDRAELRQMGTRAAEFLAQAHGSGAPMAKRFSIVSPAIDGIPHCLLGAAYLMSSGATERLEAAFTREGYQRREVDQGLVRTIQAELQRQSSPTLPPTVVAQLAPNYERMIRALVLST